MYVTFVSKKGDRARVIQTLLFVAGIKTLLQALFGTRLPAAVGGSFAYVVPIAYIINDSSLQKISNDHEVKRLMRCYVTISFCFCMYINNVVMFL